MEQPIRIEFGPDKAIVFSPAGVEVKNRFFAYADIIGYGLLVTKRGSALAPGLGVQLRLATPEDPNFDYAIDMFPGLAALEEEQRIMALYANLVECVERYIEPVVFARCRDALATGGELKIGTLRMNAAGVGVAGLFKTKGYAWTDLGAPEISDGAVYVRDPQGRMLDKISLAELNGPLIPALMRYFGGL